jgi:radical SAM enzyme (TIGR01210 family)
MDLTRPALVEWGETHRGGTSGRRLMVVLRAPGCAHHTRTGGCTNCGFAQTFGTGCPVDAASLHQQLAVAARAIPTSNRDPVHVDLYVSGSFFNQDEVPVDAQSGLIASAARLPNAVSICVETRPEHVDAEALNRARQAAAGVSLEIAIGLESADDAILRDRIHKGFRWADFERAAARVAGAGLRLLVYVLLKPMGTAEREAIEDAVATCLRVSDLGRRLGCPVRASLGPCFVAAGTALEVEHLAGRYRPPWLWSAVEVVRRVAPHLELEVGLSDEGLSQSRVAHNCEACTPRVIAALRAFVRSQDPAPLGELACSCQAEWRADLVS